MQRDRIVNELKDFVVKELLDGSDRSLDDRTPLLQWGILDSLAMVSILAFIEDRFGIEVPDESVRPEHFENLGKLSDLLVGLRVAA